MVDRAKSPDLDENDIPFHQQFSDDRLYDATVHTHRAEARIHALRARLQKGYRKDRLEHELHDKQNKVADTSEEEKKLMMKIRQMEEMVRRRDEVNNRYAIELNNMVRKDGEVESLKVENIALQKKLELINISLGKHLEEQEGYELEKKESTYSKDELDGLRDAKSRIYKDLWDEDDKLKLAKDENDARSHEIDIKRAELEKLRVSTKDLSEKLTVDGGKKDEALARLSSEKQALMGELARKKDEKVKVTEENEMLQSDVKLKEQMEEKIGDQLRTRDSDLAELNLDKSFLDAQVAELDTLRKKLAKLDAKIKESDEELVRRSLKYQSLSNEEADLGKEVEAQRLIIVSGKEAYQELEKKISEFQAAIAGSHDKEIALLRKIDHAKLEIDEVKPKFSSEMQRHEELERENAILKQKLSELAESSLLEQRKLREELEERTSKEAELRRVNAKDKKMLDEAIAKNGGFQDKIESYKAIQMKEEEDMELMTVEETEAEVTLEGRMSHLLKRGNKRNRSLAEASEMEAKMADQVSIIEKEKVVVQEELAQKETAVVQLQNTVVEKERAQVKQKQDNSYQHQARKEALKAEIDALETKVQSVQRAAERRPSQIEAQSNRLESLEEQIYTRDQQIETLYQAMHTSKLASARKPVVAMKRMFHGYEVTAVLDHRHRTDEITFYKHRKPLGDWHHVVYAINMMPEISIETALERKRRREAKLRRIHERRPSMG